MGCITCYAWLKRYVFSTGIPLFVADWLLALHHTTYNTIHPDWRCTDTNTALILILVQYHAYLLALVIHSAISCNIILVYVVTLMNR